ncbi:MAG: hypothetical protein WD602_08140 [Actinomycetota bacterium]
MRAVLTIASASILEHRRRKLIGFFVVATLAIVAGLIYLTLNTDLGATLVNAAVGMATIASVGLLPAMTVLAAIAVSMNNVGRPFADGEAALILARPVARWQFVLGRLLGSIAVIVGLCALMALLATSVGTIDQSGVNPDVLGHWAVTAFNLSLLAGIVTFMSTLIGHPLIAAFSGYLLYAAATPVSALYVLVSNGNVTGGPAAVITAAWFITPKKLLSPLSQSGAAAESGIGSSVADGVLLAGNGARFGWALAYLAVAVTLSFLIAERKEVS